MKAFAAGGQLALTLSLFSLNVFGQTPPPPPSEEIPRPAPREQTRGQRNDPWRTLEELKNLKLGGVRYEPRLVKKGPLAPAAQDQADHAVFLKQSNTGLIRLLPSRTGNEKIVRGGGSYYSFHFLSHEYGRGSDLELTRPLIFRSGNVPEKSYPGSLDAFSVGFGGANYGMLTNLGEVPLDEITLKDQRARYLAEYEPPVSESEARCEFRRFSNGETIEGRLYKRSLPVQVGASYLVRSISYGESDVLVAFRVARRDDDGSAIITWKLLKDFRARHLKVTGANNCN
jgi:hypothetical protein